LLPFFPTRVNGEAAPPRAARQRLMQATASTQPPRLLVSVRPNHHQPPRWAIFLSAILLAQRCWQGQACGTQRTAVLAGEGYFEGTQPCRALPKHKREVGTRSEIEDCYSKASDSKSGSQTAHARNVTSHVAEQQRTQAAQARWPPWPTRCPCCA
jgi:hypothetical protein